MSKDGPVSGRMGFGPEQAHEAGVPWEAIRPPSTSEMNTHKRQRQAEAKAVQARLDELRQHPQLQQRLLDLIASGRPHKEAFEVVDRECRESLRRTEALMQARK